MLTRVREVVRRVVRSPVWHRKIAAPSKPILHDLLFTLMIERILRPEGKMTLEGIGGGTGLLLVIGMLVMWFVDTE